MIETEEALSEALLRAGICLRASSQPEDETVVPVPIAATPAPFPRWAFEQARGVQPHFNRLIYGLVRERGIIDMACRE